MYKLTNCCHTHLQSVLKILLQFLHGGFLGKIQSIKTASSFLTQKLLSMVNKYVQAFCFVSNNIWMSCMRHKFKLFFSVVKLNLNHLFYSVKKTRLDYTWRLRIFRTGLGYEKVSWFFLFSNFILTAFLVLFYTCLCWHLLYLNYTRIY